MDFKNLPYDHQNWVKKYPSIMNKDDKVTWPQLIAEMVIFLRKTYIKTFPKIPMGKGWSQSIQKQVRELNQQATVICNYFPHPDNEPLVIYAVKKYFREQKPFKIGQFRKTRVTKNGSLNITQSEKDVVLGINAELTKVIKSRESFNTATMTKEEYKEKTFNTTSQVIPKKGNLAYLMALEKGLNSQPAKSE